MKITYFDLLTGETAVEPKQIETEDLISGEYAFDNKRQDAFGLKVEQGEVLTKERFRVKDIENDDGKFDRSLWDLVKHSNKGYPDAKELSHYYYHVSNGGITYSIERDMLNRLYLTYRQSSHGVTGASGKVLISNLETSIGNGPTDFILWFASNLETLGLLDTVPDFEGYQKRKKEDAVYEQAKKFKEIMGDSSNIKTNLPLDEV